MNNPAKSDQCKWCKDNGGNRPWMQLRVGGKYHKWQRGHHRHPYSDDVWTWCGYLAGNGQ